MPASHCPDVCSRWQPDGTNFIEFIKYVPSGHIRVAIGTASCVHRAYRVAIGTPSGLNIKEDQRKEIG